MASIMQSMKVQNKPSRNSFDMSENCAFSACLGAYQPVRHMHLNIGDKVKDRLRFFSRTSPVRSAAYGRIRESFDVFFVPYRLLWRGYEGFFTDGKERMNDNNNVSYLTDQSSVPFFTSNSARSILNDVFQASLPFWHKQEKPEDTVSGADDPHNIGLSFYGASRARDMQRLLTYLGYGKLITYGHDANYANSSTYVPRENIPLNALPLLAYHKIYYDFYRNSQWENNQPHMWYFNGSNSMDLNLSDPTDNYIESPHIFDLHFSNYEKDKYLGVLPNSQLGEPSVVSTADNVFRRSGDPKILALSQNGIALTTGGTIANPNINSEQWNNYFNFSILALRQSSAMQKWKEISQFATMDYKHQLQVHYGFSIDEGRSNLVQYIDGCSSLIEINSVLNQNLADTNEASIQGKGDNVGQCDIDFTAPEPGLLMVIYHANPLVDYNGAYNMVPECAKHFASDFPIPEFDSLGLQAVYQREVDTRYFSSINPSSLRGYAPRYIDFKSRVDRTLGDFNESRASWVIPLPDRVVLDKAFVPKPKFFGKNIEEVTAESVAITQNYCRFKVDPSSADSIFFFSPDVTYNGYNSDPILVDCSFQTTKVSNLNYSGMPY